MEPQDPKRAEYAALVPSWQQHCESDPDRTCEVPLFKVPCYPQWQVNVVDEEVQALANKECKVLSLSQCVGPSIGMLVRCCLIQLSVKVVILALGLVRASPSNAQYRDELLYAMIGVWVLYILWQGRTEFQCVKYTTIPYVQVMGGFTILGRSVGFTSFLLFGYVQSFIANLGMFTGTLFTANHLFQPFRNEATVTLLSNTGHAVHVSQNTAWCMALKASVVPEAISAEWKDIIVGMAWLLMASPEIYSLLFRYFPKCGSKPILRQVGKKPYPDGQVDNWELLAGGSTSVGGCALDLGEGACMGTFKLQTPSHGANRAETIWRELEEDEGILGAQEVQGAQEPQELPMDSRLSTKSRRDSIVRDEIDGKAERRWKTIRRGILHINGIAPRACRRLMLESLAKNVMQANVQITLFAMYRLSDQGDYHWFSILSILVCLVPALQGVAFGTQILHMVISTLSRVSRLSHNDKMSAEEVEELRKEISGLRVWLYKLCAVFVVFIAAVSYVVAKLIGAVYVCPHYLWNVTPPFCVDLSSHLQHVKDCTLNTELLL